MEGLSRRRRAAVVRRRRRAVPPPPVESPSCPDLSVTPRHSRSAAQCGSAARTQSKAPAAVWVNSSPAALPGLLARARAVLRRPARVAAAPHTKQSTRSSVGKFQPGAGLLACGARLVLLPRAVRQRRAHTKQSPRSSLGRLQPRGPAGPSRAGAGRLAQTRAALPRSFSSRAAGPSLEPRRRALP